MATFLLEGNPPNKKKKKFPLRALPICQSESFITASADFIEQFSGPLFLNAFFSDRILFVNMFVCMYLCFLKEVPKIKKKLQTTFYLSFNKYKLHMQRDGNVDL